MKNLKQVILPAVIVLMGTGAAFATQVDKQKESIEVYRFDSSAEEIKCIETPEECSTTGITLCTWSDGLQNFNLYNISHEGTMCSSPLFKVN